MAQLAFTLLGSFQVTLDGRPVTDLATDKARALLVYLAVEHDRPHRREALAALLWPDQPADRARQSLRQALVHVRHAVCDTTADCPFLLIERNEVQLNPAADVRLDVTAFTRLSDACKSHPHRNLTSCLPCLHRFQAMLALYHGEFLAGFLISDSELFEEWALLKREWLHMRAMEGLAHLADYHEQRDELDIARRYVQQQVQLEPWREEAHRQLIRLLALAGQRSTALAQYELCRRILHSEFGAEPASETTKLWLQIRDGILTPPTTVKPMTSPAAPFVGRDTELDEIAEWLAGRDCRLVTITGPGGIGKTRLAQQSAEQHHGLFTDGVVFVNLTSVSSGDMIAPAIGDALALPPAPHSDPTRLFRYLRNKNMLIVLDNFEHLVDSGQFLSDLLYHAPSVILLVTSREKLRLREEWVYVLEGLAYPPSPAEVDGAPLSYSAVALFRHRAIQVQRHFALTDGLLPDVIRICDLVEGLPLGVELAAAATADRSCAEIATALERTLDALETSLRNVPARHRSLRAAFEHSWALLTPGEQGYFMALAVFSGGFDAEAARAVAGATQRDLATLTAKSLLTFDGARYLWHEATHQYAVERLEANPNAITLRGRHSAHFAARLSPSAAAFDGADACTLIDTLERDRANLRAAWQWAVSRQHVEELGTMAEGIGKFYRLRGPAQEGLNMITDALESLPAVAQAQEHAYSLLLARLWAERTQLLNLQVRYEEALQSVTHLITLGEQISSPLWESTGHFLKGQTLQQQGKYEAARQALERGLQAVQATETPGSGNSEVAVLKADLLRELGNIALRRGDQVTAQGQYEEALCLYQGVEDRRGENAVINNLGILSYDRGDYTGARAWLTKALVLYRALANLPGEAKALNNLANVAADQRDYSAALQHYQAALQVHRTIANTHAQSGVLNNLGALYWELGLYVEARDAYRQALSIFRESGNRQAEGETLANLSLLELRVGSPRAALPLAQEATAASVECQDLSNLANTYTYLGQIHTALQQWDDAESWYREALAIRKEVVHPGRSLELTAELACLTWQRGRPAEALIELAPVLAALQTTTFLEGAEDPYHVYWICYEVLQANADARAAACLATAQKQLLDQANRIPDPVLRRSFLENVPTHRRVAAL
jgi:predicted ATPase/DNA-binding SARP family transcriptional activator/Tfp pilus assembly protein PilF